MKELSSYVYSPLREGDIALYRGSGNGLAPILLVAAEETSLGCVQRQSAYFFQDRKKGNTNRQPQALGIRYRRIPQHVVGCLFNGACGSCMGRILV